ncbi:hypothetical protein MRX96_020160 [Rhipicephalus microplus]
MRQAVRNEPREKARAKRVHSGDDWRLALKNLREKRKPVDVRRKALPFEALKLHLAVTDHVDFADCVWSEPGCNAQLVYTALQVFTT